MIENASAASKIAAGADFLYNAARTGFRHGHIQTSARLAVARHNRETRAIDQKGVLWNIGYQPDWLSRVKISRFLPGGRRRSSLTLFRNPQRRAEAPPGRLVRTDIRAVDGSMRFRVAVEDPDDVIESVTVVTRKRRNGEAVKFVLEARLPRLRRTPGAAQKSRNRR